MYTPVAQTRYDPTGKSLVISYTGYPNILQAINVVSFRTISSLICHDLHNRLSHNVTWITGCSGVLRSRCHNRINSRLDSS